MDHRNRPHCLRRLEGHPGGGVAAAQVVGDGSGADGAAAPARIVLNTLGPLSPAGALAPTRV